jgi:hypothetical protein
MVPGLVPAPSRISGFMPSGADRQDLRMCASAAEKKSEDPSV